eukprot:6481948-Amphidinium_carterae.1
MVCPSSLRRTTPVLAEGLSRSSSIVCLLQPLATTQRDTLGSLQHKHHNVTTFRMVGFCCMIAEAVFIHVSVQAQELRHMPQNHIHCNVSNTKDRASPRWRLEQVRVQQPRKLQTNQKTVCRGIFCTA